MFEFLRRRKGDSGGDSGGDSKRDPAAGPASPDKSAAVPGGDPERIVRRLEWTVIRRLDGLASGAPVDVTARQDLDTRLSSLEAAYATLIAFSSNTSANVLTIIEPAVPPDSPSAPRVLVNTALGAATALFIALGLLLLHEELRGPQAGAAAPESA